MSIVNAWQTRMTTPLGTPVDCKIPRKSPPKRAFSCARTESDRARRSCDLLFLCADRPACRGRRASARAGGGTAAHVTRHARHRAHARNAARARGSGQAARSCPACCRCSATRTSTGSSSRSSPCARVVVAADPRARLHARRRVRATYCSGLVCELWLAPVAAARCAACCLCPSVALWLGATFMPCVLPVFCEAEVDWFVVALEFMRTLLPLPLTPTSDCTPVAALGATTCSGLVCEAWLAPVDWRWSCFAQLPRCSALRRQPRR